MGATASESTQSNSNQASHSKDLGGKYLTFRLAGEFYGVEIRKVSEINGIVDITSIPRSLDFMKGVINLRGKIIPVIDLRMRLGMQEAEHTDETCIIVVNVAREVGLVVDSVSEVLDIDGDLINPAPSMGSSASRSYILGIAKVEETMKILLDIDLVLAEGANMEA